MPHLVRRGLFLLLLAMASPAFTAELNDYQKLLLTQLPSVEQVLAVVPPRSDPLESAMAREVALGHMHDMVDTIVARSRSEEVHETLNRYHVARNRMHIETLKMIKAHGMSQEVLSAGESKLLRIAQGLSPTLADFYSTRAELFTDVLTGQLRDYAMEWHYLNGGASVPLSATAQLMRWATKQPPAVRRTVEVGVAIPSAVWYAALALWIALGLRYRSAPLDLDPNDPFTLLRGRQRREMGHYLGEVVSEQTQEQVRQTRTVRVNEYGQQQGSDDVRTFHSVTQTINVRKSSGTHETLTLRNSPFGASKGDRLLVVYDRKSTHYLYIYNYDTGKIRYMPLIQRYYRLRPLIAIPVWVLATVAASWVSPGWGSIALVLTPVVYFGITWRLNRRRWRKLENELIPRMVAAAR